MLDGKLISNALKERPKIIFISFGRSMYVFEDFIRLRDFE